MTLSRFRLVSMFTGTAFAMTSLSAVAQPAATLAVAASEVNKALLQVLEGKTIQLRNEYKVNDGSVNHLDDLGIGNRSQQISHSIKELAANPAYATLPKSVWVDSVQATLAADSVRKATAQINTADYQAIELTAPGDPFGAFPMTAPAARTTQAATQGSVQTTCTPIFAAGKIRRICGFSGNKLPVRGPMLTSPTGDPKARTIAVVNVETAKQPSNAIQFEVAHPSDGIKRSEDKSIYGQDNRRDYFEIPIIRAKQLALSVASISPKTERSIHARGYCTGFLVGVDKVITAGHCVNREDSSSKVIRFNDFLVAAGRQPSERLESWDIEDVVAWDFNHDIAIITLRPDKDGRRAGDLHPPLSLSRKPRKVGTQIYMIGHPGHDYLKFGLCNIVRDHYFSEKFGKHILGVDCDAFGGNSGSPILDASTNEVVGLLWGGQSDARTYAAATEAEHEYVSPFHLISPETKFGFGAWPNDVALLAGEVSLRKLSLVALTSKDCAAPVMRRHQSCRRLHTQPLRDPFDIVDPLTAASNSGR